VIRTSDDPGERGLIPEPTEVLTRTPYEEPIPLLELDGVGRLGRFPQEKPGEEDDGDKEYRALQINEY
jgi:hypothetical protein